MAIIDTTIWSLYLRRNLKNLSVEERRLRFELIELIKVGQAVMIGPVRQEILTGIKNEEKFERLRAYLTNFEDAPLTTHDYENAARFSNLLMPHGVVGTDVDLLICAAAYRLGARIFTTDPDFVRYAEHLLIKLYRL